MNMVAAKKTIESLREGDVKAFDELYYQYNDIVYNNIYKIIRQKEVAEEILQDVFSELWQNRSGLDSEKSVGGWLIVVSRNKAISCLRKKIKEKISVDISLPLDISDDIENRDDIESQFNLLYLAIDQLPPKRKKVFMLCKLEGKSYREASEILEISIYTVKEHLMAASKTIKEFIVSHPAKNTSWLLSFLFECLQ